jgi:hypothetical protein
VPGHDQIAVRFTAELTNVQTEAVTAMAKHLTGALPAPFPAKDTSRERTVKRPAADRIAGARVGS